MTETITTDELPSLLDSMCQSLADADYTEPLKDGQQMVAEYEAGMFAGEFDSNLVDWAPLKPSTVKKKGHDRILVDSGALRESLVHVGGHGNVNEIFDHGMVFGTEIPYAGFLQDGTSKMPARPPVGISEETIDKITEKIADAAVEALLSGV